MVLYEKTAQHRTDWVKRSFTAFTQAYANQLMLAYACQHFTGNMQSGDLVSQPHAPALKKPIHQFKNCLTGSLTDNYLPMMYWNTKGQYFK